MSTSQKSHLPSRTTRSRMRSREVSEEPLQTVDELGINQSVIRAAMYGGMMVLPEVVCLKISIMSRAIESYKVLVEH